jgi:hypothetical protein
VRPPGFATLASFEEKEDLLTDKPIFRLNPPINILEDSYCTCCQSNPVSRLKPTNTSLQQFGKSDILAEKGSEDICYFDRFLPNHGKHT